MQPIDGYFASPPVRPRGNEADLAKAARALEASFLSIMLREAGVGTPRGAFGGGAGEEQFASFLTDAYAGKLVEAGGIGLAERLFQALQGVADAGR